MDASVFMKRGNGPLATIQKDNPLSKRFEPVSKTALFIKHKALPDKRDEVRRIWEKHLKSRIAANPTHEADFYRYDDNDADTICVFRSANKG